MGTGGFFPIGGGNFGFCGMLSVVALLDKDDGLKLLLRPESAGFSEGGAGLAREGPVGFGEETVGNLGAETERAESESGAYDESLLAPVSTPAAVLRSFGIPPAKMPPNCGAASPAGASPPLLLGASLVALALLPPPPGMGGAVPGTGGAPPTRGRPEPSDSFATTGAERSFVTAFFSRLPFSMSPNRAPCGHR